MRRIIVCFVVTLFALVGIGTSPAFSHASITERVSISSFGQQGNAGSYSAAVNADGRYVAFTSDSSNLVLGDTNNATDVFVRDRRSGQTTRVSISSDGQQGNDWSYSPKISGDGRYVAFYSNASNLTSGDSNNSYDVFVHDCWTEETKRVSVSSYGEQANSWSGGPDISANGRYVFFMSDANNLVSDDTNGEWDAFVHDLATGVTSRVSVSSSGGQANNRSWSGSISADGRYVAFYSRASNLDLNDTNGFNEEIFVHDCQTGETTRVNVSTSGQEANSSSHSPSISGDGRYVVFTSWATNLVANDTNNVADVFLHDRQTGETTRINLSSMGEQANDRSGVAVISGAGQHVAFESYASNLVDGDSAHNVDIFVRDLSAGRTERVSVSNAGEESADCNSGWPSISYNRQFIAFSSTASFVTGDTNGVSDVFIHGLGPRIDKWTSTGPEGGYVHSVVVSPAYATDQTLFAGTWGGVCMSTDGGASWSPVNSGLANTDVCSVALSPAYATDRTLFAGTSGDGVFKSTDGGTSWSEVNSGLTNTNVISVALSPAYATDRTLFAGTWGGGVFRSTDGGASWTAVNSGIANTDVRSVVLSPAYATDRTVFTGSGDGLFRSTDGGASWTAVNAGLTNTDIYSLALSPAYATDRTLFAGTWGGVFRSTDGGASWSPVNSGLTDTHVKSVAISPAYATDRTLFAGTFYYGVCVSTDGGASWSPGDSGLADTRSVTTSPTYATDRTLFAGTWSSGVFKSTDGGASWSQINSGLINTIIYSVAISPAYATDRTLFAGTYYYGVCVSTDGGASWSQVNSGLTNTSVFSVALSPAYATDRTLFAGTSEGGVFRSTDGGASWSQVNSGLTNTYVQSVALSPAYATDQTLFAGTNDGVFKSTDGGASWTAANSGIANTDVRSVVLSPAYATDRTLFAGAYRGGVFKSTDGGASWSEVNSGLTNTYVRSVTVSPAYATDQTLFAGTNGGVYGGVFKSTDGGASWNRVLTNTYVRSVTVSPAYATDRALFAGTWGGVCVSTDGGASWSEVNSGLTNTNVISVVLSPAYATDRTLFAGTWGSGVFSYTFSDTTHPATLLQTSPSLADGNNSWFKTTPIIALTPSEEAITYYQWDSTDGSWTTCSSSFAALEGEHTLYYCSEDNAGNKEKVKSQQFKVDTQAPASFTQNLPANEATVNKPYPYFSWNPSSDSGSGLAKYQLYIDGSLARDNIVDWTAAVPESALSNGSHTWFVRAWDNAGNYTDSATQSFTVSAGAGKIAFASDRNGNHEIYIMDADGSSQTRLTNNTAIDWLPDFSPDGAKIAFTSYRDGNYEIYIMDADGSSQTRLTNNTAIDYGPVFSPDGAKIAFTSYRDGNDEIYVMNVDGSSQTRLTNNTAIDYGPVFSPDGSKITFASDRDGNYEIYIMDADGSGQKRLTNNTASEWLPDFSPDGSKIAFYGNRDGNDEIYVMNVDGSSQIRLTNNIDSDWSPDFSPDGSKITFASYRDGNDEIYVMNADGSCQTRLTNNTAIEYYPAWGPGSLTADTTPPTSSLSTNPPDPDGQNGWFITIPSITLSSDESGTTYYQWDSTAGAWTTYSEPFAALHGEHTLYYRSIDVAGNIEAPKTELLKVTWNGPGAYMTRVSVDSVDTQANEESYWPLVSSDGRYVAFVSWASNLVPNDTNGGRDVFRKDLLTGEITRVSTDVSGNQANGESWHLSISADGRYVAFTSLASNLVSGDTDGYTDTFRKDLLTGEIIRVSTDSSGNQANGDSGYPSISADGRYVSFQSRASNLVLGDTNSPYWDIFRKDLVTGEIIRVSTDSSGNQVDGHSQNASTSSDGRYVVFISDASNLVPGDTNNKYDVFRKDIQTGEIIRVSTDSSGNQANGLSYNGLSAISSDGRYVVFASYASNLVPGDTNGYGDIFRRDLQTGEIIRLSTDSLGNQANDLSKDPFISSDGRYVAFFSWASNLVPNDTNSVADVFRRDLQTGETIRLSTDSLGNQANGESEDPSISSDGRYVAFDSWASNLVSDDTNNTRDIFLADMNLYSAIQDMTGPSTSITNPLNGQTVSGTMHINAIIDDSSTGNSNISEATYSIDSGAPIQMNPIDGTFDSPIENVTAQLDTTLITEGYHTISVQGRDIAGNWSAAAAIGVYVDNIPNEQYYFITKWGSQGSGDGQFNRPVAIVNDSFGNLLVLDENVYAEEVNKQYVHKFDSNGNFITKWGSFGLEDGQLKYPQGIAIDTSGNIFIADTSNHRIQKFDANGNFVNRWGSFGSGDGQFNFPHGIAVDSFGNIYVTDTSNNRIQKFDASGNFITKWGGQGSGNGQFDYPIGIALDSLDNLYVADTNNSRIQKFDTNGNFIIKWGSWGKGDGQFKEPIGIAIDVSGNVYVAGNHDSRVQKFDSTGNFITTWGTAGTDDGQFNNPHGVAVDTTGNVYVADSDNVRIQKFSPIPPDTQGPSTTITNPTGSQTVGGTIDINATIDDSSTGNSNIAEATYSVDGGAPVQMNPSDGAFDSPTEDVTAQLDTTTFSNGNHTIAVMGKDAAGNWSSAATVNVDVYNHINNPPIADAGGPYAGNEGSPIAFDGSASSDPDGDTLQYRWDFDSDAIWDTEWSASPTASHTWSSAWSGIATLEVSDGTLTAADMANVTVTKPAPAGYVEIDFSQIVFPFAVPGLEQELVGDLDMMTPDKPTIKNWTDTDLNVAVEVTPLIGAMSGKQITFFDATFRDQHIHFLAAQRKSFVNPCSSYSIERINFSVYPSVGVPMDTYCGTMTLSIGNQVFKIPVMVPLGQYPTNQPPVAEAGGPYTGTEGSPIVFDAAGSSDPDGDVLQYRWDFNGDGIWDTDWSISPTASHTWDNAWSGTAKLEVSDGQSTAFGTTGVTVNPVPSCIVPPDIVSWWRAEGNADDSVDSNHGTLQGGVGFAPGMVGQAFSLDGIDDYIHVPDDPSLRLASGLTIEAWIKSAATDGPRVIASKWNDNTSDWSYIFKDHNSSDKLRIELSKSYHNDLADLEGGRSILVGQWVHVATTYDANTSLVRLYFNGMEDGQLFVAPGQLIDSSMTGFLIGAVFTSGGIRENFAGLIDELTIYNRALNATEIQSIHDAGSAGKSLGSSNEPPVANADGPYTIDAGDTLSLDGSGSTDPNESCGDSIVKYEWDLDMDGDSDALGSTPSISAGFFDPGSDPFDGVIYYNDVPFTTGHPSTISLRVTDTFGATHTDTTTLTIYDNRPFPSFTANPNLAAPKQDITLDATGSTHGRPDRAIVKYEWDFNYDGDPANFAAEAEGQIVTHSYATFGTRAVALRVADDNSPPKTAIATATINVNQGNEPPVANANGPYEINLGTDLHLDSSGSSDPNEGCGDSIVKYEWTISNDDGSKAASFFDVFVDISWTDLELQDLIEPGTYYVTLKVTDTFGETDEATTTLTINNNPPVANPGGPYTMEQGSPLPIELYGTGSYDPDNPYDFIVKYGWDIDGDNKFDDAEGETYSVTWPELQGWGMSAPGDYQISLRVTDSFGKTDTKTTTLTIKNVLPTVDPGGPYFGLEGSPVLFSATASDPGGDLLTFKWDFQNDGTFEEAGQTALYAFQDDYVGDGLLCTHDLDPDPNRWVESFFDVYIQNVPPEVDPIPDMTINEGETVTLHTTFTDPGTKDTHTYTIDWKDGTVEKGVVEGGGGGGGAVSVNHVYKDNGIYTVTLTVEDDDGGTTTITTTVTVQNVAPTVEAGDNQQILEGEEISLSSTYSDPGDDTHQAQIDWGDGWVESFFDVFTSPIQRSHTYADNGVYTVIVTVREKDIEQAEGTDSFTVTVENVAPSLSAIGSQTVDEGSLLQLPSIATFTDPGFDNPQGGTTEVFTSEIDWGDGTTKDSGAATIDIPGSPGVLTSGSFGGSHTYADSGVYTVTLTVTDDDGGVGSDTLIVTVLNVSPTVSIDSMTQLDEYFILPGDVLTFTGSFTDPGWLDTHTAIWDFGDGTVAAGTITEENTQPDATGTTTVAHTYSAPGIYTVTLTVTDNDGGSSTATYIVTVLRAEDAIAITETYIQNLGNDDFKNNAMQRINALTEKLNAVADSINKELYQDAINKLQNDIRSKADGFLGGNPNNDWITDPAVQQRVCDMIDDLVAYLNTLL